MLKWPRLSYSKRSNKNTEHDLVVTVSHSKDYVGSKQRPIYIYVYKENTGCIFRYSLPKQQCSLECIPRKKRVDHNCQVS